MNPTTDKDALVASQIAYMNIKEEYIHKAEDKYGSTTLENIFKVSNGEVVRGYINRVYGNKDPKTTKLSEYEQMRLEEAKAFIEEIKNSEYAQWEIVEVKDDNANSGFYGCMIDCEKASRYSVSEEVKVTLRISYVKTGSMQISLYSIIF